MPISGDQPSALRAVSIPLIVPLPRGPDAPQDHSPLLFVQAFQASRERRFDRLPVDALVAGKTDGLEFPERHEEPEDAFLPLGVGAMMNVNRSGDPADLALSRRPMDDLGAKIPPPRVQVDATHGGCSGQPARPSLGSRPLRHRGSPETPTRQVRRSSPVLWKCILP